MSPDPGRTYTVGCSFDKLIPDEAHRTALRDAVSRVHKSTILATELLNLHVRRCIEDCTGDLEHIFNSNWLLNAYKEVSQGKSTTRVDDELRRTCDKYMPPFVPVDRKGLTQIFAYECRNLAAVGSTNVWMHFQRRVQTYVKLHHNIDRETYNALTKDERRQRYLHLLQVADDICRPNAEENRSPGSYHSWIRKQRKALGIDDAVGEWTDKPLLYHLKEKPQRFIKSMYHMSQYIEEHGGRAFALFPLRRSLVPRHIRVDQQVLRTLLHLGTSEHSKTTAKRRKMNDGCSTGDKRQRRTREDLLDEKAEAFDKVLNIRAANVRQCHLFDYAFTTDGVCVRLQYSKPTRQTQALSTIPRRGLYAIDELKRVSRLEQLHVVGVDPGIRELVVAVDQDDPRNASPVRYTLRQRLKDRCSRRYADEVRRTRPYSVTAAEEDLCEYNSRTSSLQGFGAYCRKRHEHLDVCLDYYTDIAHRKRRWKTCIKAQQSEERLYERLRKIHKPSDGRRLVLAYGAWGATSTSASVARGNPPAIGVGLMRKLSKRFVVAITPEHHTSKTCCRCFGSCGAWKEVEERMKKKVRGLRICQEETCKLPQNRDRTGASNIGLQFNRLFEGKPPIRQMNEEEKEFNRLRLVCEPCATS